MKKNTLLSFFALVITNLCFGQIEVIDNGHVGIGVTNPQDKLHVSGDIAMQDPLNEASADGRNNSIYGIGGSKRMVMSTDATSFDSYAFMSMFGTETQTGGQTSRAGEFVLAGSYFDIRTDVTTAGWGNIAMTITSDGDLELTTGDAYKLGGGSWLSLSDRRAKKDIKSFNYGLKSVLNITPVFFKYNEREVIADGSKEYVGVIAQELQKVAPFLVKEKKYKHNDYENGIHINKNYLSIDDSAIKYMLVNAIKEQQEMIENQQQTIEEKEARIIDLEKSMTEMLQEIEAIKKALLSESPTSKK